MTFFINPPPSTVSIKARGTDTPLTGFWVASGDRRNSDGTCFKWFDIRFFPDEPPLVLATSGLRPSVLSDHPG